MPRLILVFAGRTCHFVDFDMRWLKREYYEEVFSLIPLLSNMGYTCILAFGSSDSDTQPHLPKLFVIPEIMQNPTLF